MSEVVTLDPLTLTDLDTARAYLKAETTAFDDTIKQMVNLASAQIELRCKRYLLARAYDSSSVTPGDRPTMKMNGNGTNVLGPMREWPVISISSIIERYPDGVTTRTINATGYSVADGYHIILPNDAFSKGYQNIEVKGVFGYSVAAHARDRRALEAACLRWVQVMYQDRGVGIGRGTTFGVGGDIVTLIAGPMPQDVLAAISPYERLL